LIEIQPFTVAQARKSTLVVAGVLAFLSGWQVYRGRPTAASVFAVAVVVLLACAAVPRAATWFHRWWMTLAEALGYVNSRILLSLLFYGILTPVGLAVRLAGHDPLERRKAVEGSYWRKRASTRQSREGYERSF